MSVEVIYGTGQEGLFDGPGVGHETFEVGVGRSWVTILESDDSEAFCSDACAREGLTGMGFTRSTSTDNCWAQHDETRWATAVVYYGTDPEGPCAHCGDDL
jgi:hypothetical protein